MPTAAFIARSPSASSLHVPHTPFQSGDPIAPAALPLPAVPLSQATSPGRRALALRSALLVFAAWTAYGAVHAAFWLATGDFMSGWWLWVIATAMALAWTWALITPVIFRVANRFTPARAGWFATLVVHGVLFSAIAIGMSALRLACLVAFAGQEWTSFAARTVFWLDVNLFTYLTVVMTARAVYSHRRYVDRLLRAHVLETQLARAQLHYLELQLQPHFLFNSLNAIQELAHESPNAAERMLRRLHTLLGLSLERSGRDEVTLGEELAALDPYLDIQRIRFDWLAVRVQADEEARTGLVPHLILQPLVENAIRHGLSVRPAPGIIDVRGARRGDRLVLTVRDNGVGLTPAAHRSRPGIGLRNASERLRQLYGGNHRFDLREASGGGVIVEIDIPFRESVPAASGFPRSSAPAEPPVPPMSVDDISSWPTGEFAVEVLRRDDLPLPRSEPRRTTPVARPAVSAEGGADDATPPAVPLREDGGPPEAPPALFTLRTWLSLVGVWFGAAVLWTLQMQVYWELSEPTMAHWDFSIARMQLAGAMYWIAVSVGVLYLARRFRITQRRLVPHLAIHLGAAIASAFGFLWVLQAVKLSTEPILSPFNLNPLTGNFFLYFGLLAWSHSRDFVSWYRARELTSAELTSQIARSRFQALCVQLRPQFLLGTLDLLARLVHVDVPRAERLIARLADVLRLTLDTAGDHITTLKQELQLVGASVEAHRLGIRPGVMLETEIDPLALPTQLPSRLLTTMVDDLLAAGIEEGSAAPLAIRVSAERASDATRVRLHGDTMWRRAGADMHAWWRKKSAAEAAVADAGPLVTVAFPDRATAVLIIADEPLAERAEPAAA